MRAVRAAFAAALACAVCATAVAAPLNVVAIGGSNTAGWGVGAQKAYPALLEAALKAKGYDAHVANAGVSFATTNGMLERLDAAVKPGTAIVILQPGHNDTRFGGTKEQRTKNIDIIVNRMRERHIRTIVFENETVPAANYQWDGIHFTAKGHEIAAAWMLRQIVGAGPSQAAANPPQPADAMPSAPPPPSPLPADAKPAPPPADAH
jgi:acyl-CoA thioesterase-1